MSSTSTENREHIVGSGDTLGRIASQNHVSLEELLAANPEIQNPDRISIGQVIRIPSPATRDVGPGQPKLTRTLKREDKVPNVAEAEAVGPFKKAILRGSPEFLKLIRNGNEKIVFKSEEANKDDDRMMTGRLNEKVNLLADLVEAEFPGLKLRITEAWDDSTRHAPTSRHLEGRAVDITVSDQKSDKLGRLAGLAVEAGFDWVFFEDELHVHASVKRQ